MGSEVTRPTMADVAKLAGVSAMTVSRALAGYRISPTTRRRVMEVIDRLGYVPDAAAGTLSRRRSGFVGAIVPTLNNSNFAEAARGLTEAVAAAGLEILLGFSDYDTEREESLLRALLAHRPAAVVLTGAAHTDATRAMLRQAAPPVVEIWEQLAEPIGCAVGFDNGDAGFAMVHYLAGRGYRRIGYIGPASPADARGFQREAGYRRGLEALGLGPPRIERHGAPPLTMALGGEGLLRLMAAHPDTDAVFCVSDLTAFGAIMACHRQGWSVPGRIAVAGFGDFEVSRACFPSITTIGVDAYAIGHRAGEAVLAALQGGAAWPAGRKVAMPFEVLARESA